MQTLGISEDGFIQVQLSKDLGTEYKQGDMIWIQPRHILVVGKARDNKTGKGSCLTVSKLSEPIHVEEELEKIIALIESVNSSK